MDLFLHMNVKIPTITGQVNMKIKFIVAGDLNIIEQLLFHRYVNVSVLIKFSQKTSIFTLIIINSP